MKSIAVHFLDSKPAGPTGVTFGLSWPRGELKAGTPTHVRRTDGTSIPTQSWPLAYWPDGSIKWLGMAIASGTTFSVMADTETNSAGRTVIPLAADWRFQLGDAGEYAAPAFDDSAWSTVAVPHNFNGRRVGWYRRPLRIGPELAGRYWYLEFGAASLTAQVYVDGRLVGVHEGSFTMFRLPVKLETNRSHVLAVRVDNRQPSHVPAWGDYTVFGGLYRPVRLIAVGRVSLDLLDHGGPGAYLTTVETSAEQARIKVALRLRNHEGIPVRAMIRTRLADAAGKPVVEALTAVNVDGTVVQQDLSLVVPNPHLWQGRTDPYLYRLRVTVTVDGQPTDDWEQAVGLQTMAVDADKGLLLNGKVYDLHGVNAHQEIGAGVWAVSPAAIDSDLASMVEMGCTGARLVHYPHGDHTFSAGDRLGLVLWTETPVNTFIETNAAFAANALQHMRELIRQTANHPSACILALGNEIRLGKGPDPTGLLAEMIALAKQEAPGRILTIAAKGGDPVDAGLDAIGYNSYRGWYGGEPTDCGPWLDDRRREHPGLPIGLSEFGAGASIHFHSLKPKCMDYTEEWQSYLHEAHWLAIKERPWLWCKFAWLGFDVSCGRKEADTPGQNNKGLITRDRQTRKDAWYWYKANWSDDPFVYITSRRFVNRDQAETPVKIYSNCPEVELFLNGKSLGVCRSDNHLFLWPSVTLAPGENKIEVTARRDQRRLTDQCEWYYVPTKQEAAAGPKPIQ